MEQKAFEQGARISGAVAGLHRTLGAPLKVPFRVRFEQNLGAAVKQIGKESFDRAFGEGLALSPSQAVELAVAKIAPGTASVDPGGSHRACRQTFAARARGCASGCDRNDGARDGRCALHQREHDPHAHQ